MSHKWFHLKEKNWLLSQCWGDGSFVFSLYKIKKGGNPAPSGQITFPIFTSPPPTQGGGAGGSWAQICQSLWVGKTNQSNPAGEFSTLKRSLRVAWDKRKSPNRSAFTKWSNTYTKFEAWRLAWQNKNLSPFWTNPFSDPTIFGLKFSDTKFSRSIFSDTKMGILMCTEGKDQSPTKILWCFNEPVHECVSFLTTLFCVRHIKVFLQLGTEPKGAVLSNWGKLSGTGFTW